MIEKESKQKQKNAIIMVIGIIFSFLGISIMSIPFPNTVAIENLGQFGIAKGVTYPIHFTYPMFSNNQKLTISLGTVNSSFSILVLNDNDYGAWINLNQPFIGDINIIVTAETLLEIYGTIQMSSYNIIIIENKR